MKQMHVWVSGFVQGVGYRAFTRREAQKRHFNGWVMNLEDRRVEAVIQSSARSDQEGEEELKKFLQVLEKGSYFAQVKNIVVEWEEVNEQFNEFVIVR